jgi:hypothetical protein
MFDFDLSFVAITSMHWDFAARSWFVFGQQKRQQKHQHGNQCQKLVHNNTGTGLSQHCNAANAVGT